MPFSSPALTETRQARRRFPAGLRQPEGCARFGMDALLLAAFAAQRLQTLPEAEHGPALELGCGCGAALLAVALLAERCSGLGVELVPALADAARENIRLLGFADRLDIVQGALPEQDCLQRCRAWLAERTGGKQGAALVLANPPYWGRHEGRASPHALVETARRHSGTALDDFCRSAAALMRHKGYFCCIHDARALPLLLAACARRQLGIRRLLPVHPRRGQAARRILLEARKGAAHDVRVEEALYLHPSEHATGARWTEEALRFCPFLGRSS